MSSSLHRAEKAMIVWMTLWAKPEAPTKRKRSTRDPAKIDPRLAYFIIMHLAFIQENINSVLEEKQ